MSKFKISSILLSFVVVVVGLIFVSCGSSGEKSDVIKLKFASDAPTEHIATGLNEDIAKKIKEVTDGRVEVQYYGGSTLGGYASVYKELMKGTIDMAQITLPDETKKVLGAAYLPWYALNYEEAKTLFAPDSYMAGLMKEAASEDDVRFVGFCLEGFIGIGTTKEIPNINDPSAKKAFKMRSPGMATFLFVQEDIGLQPITVNYDEVPTALQTNVVEGWIGGTPNMNYAWVGDVIKQMHVNYIHAEATSYVVSEKTLAKLTKEDQDAVLKVIEEASAESFVKAEDNEKVYMDKLKKEKKVDVIEWSKELIQKYADYVREKTWTRLEKDLGKDVIDGFRAEIEKLKK